LTKQDVSSTYYHAGLTHAQREEHQLAWIRNEKRVMVATNAFGMGIDKPDVRTVVHLDVPENLEAYYQEAGRAGRDGIQSYAVVVYNDNDVTSLERKIAQSQPSVDYLKRIYQCLSNHYQLALGSAGGESFDFDIHEFSERFNLKVNEVYPALKKLEEEGLILFNESFYSPSQLHFDVDKPRLYEFQIANADFDVVIKMVLRLYGGAIMNSYVRISEGYVAKALKMKEEEIVRKLKHLDELRIASYQPMKDKPQVTFVLPRQDAEKLPLNVQRLQARKELIESKMKAMIEFVTTSHRCRMQIVQDYFGEDTFQTCGICDVCVARKKKENQTEMENIRTEVLKFVQQKPCSIEQLEEIINPEDTELFVDIVRDLVDEGFIEYDEVWRLKLRKN
jgi:ATP-dependent DNA helicase RecQ